MPAAQLHVCKAHLPLACLDDEVGHLDEKLRQGKGQYAVHARGALPGGEGMGQVVFGMSAQMASAWRRAQCRHACGADGGEAGRASANTPECGG